MTTPTNPNVPATAPSLTASMYGTAAAAKRAEDTYYEQRARELLDSALRKLGLHEDAYHIGCGSDDLDPFERASISAIVSALRTAGHRDSAEQPTSEPIGHEPPPGDIGAYPQQPSAREPVAWMLRDSRTGSVYWDAEVCIWRCASGANDCADDMNENIDDASFEAFPLYAAPPATRSDDAPRESSDSLDDVPKPLLQELRGPVLRANAVKWRAERNTARHELEMANRRVRRLESELADARDACRRLSTAPRDAAQEPIDDADVTLAIRMLGESRWYQSGEMHAESLMDVLERLLRRRPAPQQREGASEFRGLDNTGAPIYGSSPSVRTIATDNTAPLRPVTDADVDAAWFAYKSGYTSGPTPVDVHKKALRAALESFRSRRGEGA